MLPFKKKHEIYEHSVIAILDKIIPFLEIGKLNNLYEKGKAFNENYNIGDVDLEAYAREKYIYEDMAILLSEIGLVEIADCTYVVFVKQEALKLKQLKKYGKLVNYLNSKLRAEQSKIWQDRNWWWIDFLRLLVAAILGAALTLSVQYIAVQLGLKSTL